MSVCSYVCLYFCQQAFLLILKFVRLCFCFNIYTGSDVICWSVECQPVCIYFSQLACRCVCLYFCLLTWSSVFTFVVLDLIEHGDKDWHPIRFRLCLYVCVCVFMFAFMSLCLRLCLYVCVCVFMFVCFSVFTSVYLYFCLNLIQHGDKNWHPIREFEGDEVSFMSLCFCFFVFLSLHLSVFLYICLYVCLFVSLFYMIKHGNEDWHSIREFERDKVSFTSLCCVYVFMFVCFSVFTFVLKFEPD